MIEEANQPDQDASMCSICLDPMHGNKRKLFTTSCNHSFHATCFRNLRCMLCPLCRQVVEPDIDHSIKLIRYKIRNETDILKRTARESVDFIRSAKNRVKQLRNKWKKAQNELAFIKAIEREYLDDQKCKIQSLRRQLRILFQSEEMQERRRIKVAKERRRIRETHKLAREWHRYSATLANIQEMSFNEKLDERRRFNRQFILDRRKAWASARRKLPKDISKEERDQIRRQYFLTWTYPSERQDQDLMLDAARI
jgi:RING-like zinc finger